VTPLVYGHGTLYAVVMQIRQRKCGK